MSVREVIATHESDVIQGPCHPLENKADVGSPKPGVIKKGREKPNLLSWCSLAGKI
jgi:hypothetical protein